LPDAPRTVVLAVPEGEVGRLALAAETGKLLLALRGNRGAAIATSVPEKVTLRELAGGGAAPRVVAARVAEAPRPAGKAVDEGIEVVRGLKSASGE